MTTIHERMQLLVKALGLNVFKFTKEISEERAEKFYNIIKGKMKPSFETMHDIGKRFPQVNFDWLLMGRGEMFLSIDPTLELEIATSTEELSPPSLQFVNRTEMLEQQIADRDKMIMMLESEVGFLRGLVRV